ncbi:MAG: hypothetical protein AVDCRST_MAG96-3650 [uncultured Segetibacter sp.]|uniref:Uncharacterized protein n=1 Tax=uncultured Segetibacter sp. TaxID=481133 RepID=A0A6J4TV07_9BACT|nr:MAG: hypothetical protein AVDCRST_MAG96-3650 [uncultured Segetibacter sp.]
MFCFNFCEIYPLGTEGGISMFIVEMCIFSNLLFYLIFLDSWM